MKRNPFNSKQIAFATFLVSVALFASCDTKSCRCYVSDGVNPVYKEIDYVSENEPCSSLDYTSGSKYRLCTEMSDPEIDPGSIGREYKKKIIRDTVSSH